MRTPAPLLGLLLSACVLDNPKFQESASGSGSTSTSTLGATETETATETAGATSDVSVSGTGSTSGSTSTSTSSTTTADETSDGASASTAATCAGDCPECTTCVGSECVPEDMGEECGESLECGDFVAGVFITDELTAQCLAFAPAALRGACDGAGVCVEADLSGCAGTGAALTTCDSRCVRDDVTCVLGAHAAAIELSGLCVIEASTVTCAAKCEDEMGGAQELGETCDALGDCVELPPTGCGDYLCMEGVGCLSSCEGPEDCAEKATCVDAKCTEK
ncbi:MAG: hypothetical protein R3A79_12090 [Nannocystaceae bacterium]